MQFYSKCNVMQLNSIIFGIFGLIKRCISKNILKMISVTLTIPKIFSLCYFNLFEMDRISWLARKVDISQYKLRKTLTS